MNVYAMQVGISVAVCCGVAASVALDWSWLSELLGALS